MISELNIETTVELVSVQTFYKGTQPIYYQRNGNNTYALLVSNCSRVSFCTNNVDKMLDKQSVFCACLVKYCHLTKVPLWKATCSLYCSNIIRQITGGEN